MMCGQPNQGGNIVAAHSNQTRDGKGMGIKAHDCCIAYLCHSCHSLIDQGGTFSKSYRFSEWDGACIKTWTWLCQSGHIEVKE